MESQSETTQTVSALKLPVLKTREYDLWSMRMEQYLTFTDHALWEVIVNGDSFSPIASASASAKGPIPPKTAEQKLARKNELKAKSTLMLAILDEHLLKFHACKDAKSLWEAIKNRAPRNQGKRNRDDPRRNAPVDTSTSNALVVQDGIGYQMGLESLEARIVVHEKNKAIYEEDIAFLNCESDGDDNPVNDRFKKVEGYHAVPSNYTGNYMPSRPDISFVGLDDSVYKTKVSETETSISKTSKDILEKPKTVRPSAPIIKEWDIDSDNDTVATKSGQVPVNAAKQSSPRAAASISTARPVNTAAPKSKIIKKIDGGYFVAFLEEVPKGGTGPNWMFDIDTLTMSMNYQPVFVGNQTNGNAVQRAQKMKLLMMLEAKGVLDPVKEDDKSGQGEATNTNSTNRFNTVSSSINTVSSSFTTMDPGRERAQRNEFKSMFGQDKDANGNSIYRMFTPINTAGSSCNNLGGSIPVNAATLPNVDLPTDPLMPKDITDLLNTGIFSGAYDDEDVGAEADLDNLETTVNSAQEHAMVSYIKRQRRTNHKDYQNCLFAYFLSQIEPKKVTQALTDPSWIEAMQDELLRFRLQKVWRLVDYPKASMPLEQNGSIETRKIRDGYNQVIFGFEDPQFPNKVYKVEKALDGLHQASRAWYETLSTYLLENEIRRGVIDKTLFIKKDKGDILLVQVYVDDIVDSNTTPDSTNMCHRGGEINQDAKQYQVKSPLLKAEFLKTNDMVEKEIRWQKRIFLHLNLQDEMNRSFIAQNSYRLERETFSKIYRSCRRILSSTFQLIFQEHKLR
ncbi:putative ribonuclease H-like domain-containing protein [Tanacetum coccineum]